MIDLQAPDERDAAAGEYVLGTLSDEDRSAFVAALPNDPALRAQVAAWQDRLLGLSRRAAPLEPGPQLWQRIDRGLDALAAGPALPGSAARPTPPASAPAPRPAPTSPRDAWWRRLAPWQALSAFAVMASIVMTIALVDRASIPSAATGRYLAVLQSPDDRSTGWVVEVDPASRRLQLVPVGNGTVPAGRSLQFWTKPQGAAGPTSLGLVSPGRRLELPVARLPAVGEQQLFEITLEPEGGSPLGRPTGPVLYLGRTVHL